MSVQQAEHGSCSITIHMSPLTARSGVQIQALEISLTPGGGCLHFCGPHFLYKTKRSDWEMLFSFLSVLLEGSYHTYIPKVLASGPMATTGSSKKHIAPKSH